LKKKNGQQENNEEPINQVSRRSMREMRLKRKLFLGSFCPHLLLF
jgi:hypothetical protein